MHITKMFFTLYYNWFLDIYFLCIMFFSKLWTAPSNAESEENEMEFENIKQGTASENGDGQQADPEINQADSNLV